jgi:RimJ/RimL family protein N-acetyltransferase
MIADIYEFDTYFHIIRESDCPVYLRHCTDRPNSVFLCIKKNHDTEINSINCQDIGLIWDAGLGLLDNTTKLAWKIDENYQGQGLTSLALKQYLKVAKPDSAGFEVYIQKHNKSSFFLAIKNGFKIEMENETAYTLLLKI